MIGPALAGGGLRIGDGTPFFVFLVGGCGVAVAWSLALRRRLPPPVDLIDDHRVDALARAEAA